MDNFELHETYASYVPGSNAPGLSIAERLPKKINWCYGGKDHVLKCSDGLVAKHLDLSIAVIEAPYEPKKNYAYLVTAHNHLIAELPKMNQDQPLFYYDILLKDSGFIFLAASHQGDFQLTVDLVTGLVTSIREFR